MTILALAMVWLIGLCLGLAVYSAVERRFPSALTPSEAVLLAVGGAGAVAFLCYWLHPVLGKAYSAFVLAAAFLVLILFLKRRWSDRSWPVGLDRVRPLAMPLVVGLGYLALFTGWGDTVGGLEPNRLFFNDFRPPDNHIPWAFSRALIEGDSSKLTELSGGWRFSDRPPLQAGVYAMLTGIFGTKGSGLFLPVGIFCQLLGFLGIGALAERGVIGRRAFLLTVAFTAISGLTFFYTLFTWPKLMAAGFGLVAVGAMHRLAVTGSARRLGAADSVILAVASALAMLSHGGAVFSLAGFGLVYGLVAMRARRFGALAGGVALALMFYMPWAAYQAAYNPPGDRLAKMHFAGVHEVNEEQTALELIVSAYRSTPIGVVAEYKAQNVFTLFGKRQLDRAQWEVLRGAVGGTCDPANVRASLEPFGYMIDVDAVTCSVSSLVLLHRIDQREHVFRAVAIPLSIAVLALLFAWSRRTRGMPLVRESLIDRRETAPGTLPMLLSGQLASAVLWCLSMFFGGETVITHASMAFVVLFLVLAALIVARAHVAFAVAALALVTVDFLLTWVAFMPECGTASCMPIAASGSIGLVAVGLALVLSAAIPAGTEVMKARYSGGWRSKAAE